MTAHKHTTVQPQALKVEVKKALLSDKIVILNLIQLYMYTFSTRSTLDSSDFCFNRVGQFDFPYPDDPSFDSYWTEKNYYPYLIYANKALAGFALITTIAASGQPTDFFVQEFFISAKYQHHGIGTHAALQIFQNHPGKWELTVVKDNDAARAFWKQTLENPAIKHFELFSGKNKQTPCDIFRFSIE
ncbi:MAG: GNAT family N-acetyltransferase [Pseudomonadota bacterium]